MQDEPQSITTPTTTTFTTASSHKIFNKNVINNESILLNDLAQNSASHLLNIDKYKLYVEQTEQTVTQLYKQIAKLTDVLRECKKIFQTQTQFEDMLADPLLSLAKCSYNKELSFVFEKLADLSRVSAENSKLFLNKFCETTLNPLEQLNRQFSTLEKENTKKNLDKAFKVYETKM